MKRFLVLLLFIPFLFLSCASMPDLDFEFADEINWDDVGTELAVKSTANALGYFVGKSGDSELESTISMHYSNIKAGQIELVALNEGLKFITAGGMDPLLGLLLTNALGTFGAVFVAGELIELDIPPEIWVMAEAAYEIGLALGKSQLSFRDFHKTEVYANLGIGVKNKFIH